MSMTSRAATELQNTGSFAGIWRWIARFGRALVQHWHRREAIIFLNELDDRALRDIGLLRCHIEDAVRGEAAPRLSGLPRIVPGK